VPAHAIAVVEADVEMHQHAAFAPIFVRKRYAAGEVPAAAGTGTPSGID
jgi:hypothetical protein